MNITYGGYPMQITYGGYPMYIREGGDPMYIRRGVPDVHRGGEGGTRCTLFSQNRDSRVNTLH